MVGVDVEEARAEVKRAANRRGHAGVAGDRSNAGTAVVSRRGR